MTEKYLSIVQINNYIKNLFDTNLYLKKVYLKGEISNFKHHSSGHLYLTLKDDSSRISAIMFKSAASLLNFKPEDGMNVLVEGRVAVYPAGGNYQIYIEKMEPDGLGNLYIEFEKLKRKLASEGLFDAKYKKEIPKFPMRIGIITAPTGAAIKDILSTLKRRFPYAKTLLFPSLVQGFSAASSIAQNIYEANRYRLDVLIVGRGGGSIEDLWAFNEEVVARAIFASKIPIISAVGHEVDFTIADYVADKRAPTPTGAAEMAVPTKEEVKTIFKQKEEEINHLFLTQLESAKHNFNTLKNHYVLKNPQMLYEMKMQHLDNLTDNLQKNYQYYLSHKQNELAKYKNHYVLNNPTILYQKAYENLKSAQERLQKEIKSYLSDKSKTLYYTILNLKLLNPLNILEQGYAIVKKDNKIIKTTQNIKIEDTLDVTLSKGTLKVKVEEIQYERNDV